MNMHIFKICIVTPVRNMHIHGAPKYTYFYAYPMHIVELQFGTYKPLEGKGRNLKSKVTI
jgi:hypothetical protein